MAELETVLPLPSGDPAALDATAASLRLVAGRSAETVLAGQAGTGLDLAALWTGPAFEAARAELSSAGAALRDLGSRCLPAAAALDGYAAALTTARRLVTALHEQWQAADRALHAVAAEEVPGGADPAVGLVALQAAEAFRERTRRELLDRYASGVRALEAAEEQAAAAVLRALGDASSPDRRRSLLLGQLPLTAAAQRRADATALVDRVLAGYDRDPTTWTGPQLQQLLTAVAGSPGDPFVARALLARLGPEGLEHATSLLGPGGDGPSPRPLEWTDAARRTLAVAFATTVSDQATGDPATAAALGEQSWVDSLLERPVAGLTAQLGLLTVAASGSAPLVPSTRYAGGVLQALLRGDVPLHRPLEWRPGLRGRLLGSVLTPAPDGFDLLFSTLAANPARARQVLLSPGVQGPTLVHDLVASRPFAHPRSPVPATSSEALGRLLGQPPPSRPRLPSSASAPQCWTHSVKPGSAGGSCRARSL